MIGNCYFYARGKWIRNVSKKAGRLKPAYLLITVLGETCSDFDNTLYFVWTGASKNFNKILLYHI